MRAFKTIPTAVFLLATLLSGCADKKQAQQIAELDGKVTETQRRLSAMETDLKRTTFEINQLKTLMSRVGETVVGLQRAAESRHAKQPAAANKGGARAKGTKNAAAKGKKKQR